MESCQPIGAASLGSAIALRVSARASAEPDPGDPQAYGSVGIGARAPIRPSEAERIDRFPGGSPPGSSSRPVEPRASRDVPFAVWTRDRVLRNTFARMLRVRGHNEQEMYG